MRRMRSRARRAEGGGGGRVVEIGVRLRAWPRLTALVEHLPNQAHRGEELLVRASAVDIVADDSDEEDLGACAHTVHVRGFAILPAP